MKIQINSDKTIAVDASLMRFVEGEVKRVLGRFATRLTRVEIHLSDVDNRKTGQADKRCLVEVRPAGAQPQSASAQTTKVASAVVTALRKTQRSLATAFGRRGRPAAAPKAKKTAAEKAATTKTVTAKKAAKKTTLRSAKRVAVKNAAAEKPGTPSRRGPKKKRIYQARRKAWPTR